MNCLSFLLKKKAYSLYSDESGSYLIIAAFITLVILGGISLTLDTAHSLGNKARASDGLEQLSLALVAEDVDDPDKIPNSKDPDPVVRKKQFVDSWVGSFAATLSPDGNMPSGYEIRRKAFSTNKYFDDFYYDVTALFTDKTLTTLHTVNNVNTFENDRVAYSGSARAGRDMPPMTIMTTFDTSGSMRDTPPGGSITYMDLAKKLTQDVYALIREKSPDSRLGVMPYGWGDTTNNGQCRLPYIPTRQGRSATYSFKFDAGYIGLFRQCIAKQQENYCMANPDACSNISGVDGGDGSNVSIGGGGGGGGARSGYINKSLELETARKDSRTIDNVANGSLIYNNAVFDRFNPLVMYHLSPAPVWTGADWLTIGAAWGKSPYQSASIVACEEAASGGWSHLSNSMISIPRYHIVPPKDIPIDLDATIQAAFEPNQGLIKNAYTSISLADTPKSQAGVYDYCLNGINAVEQSGSFHQASGDLSWLQQAMSGFNGTGATLVASGIITGMEVLLRDLKEQNDIGDIVRRPILVLISDSDGDNPEALISNNIDSQQDKVVYPQHVKYSDFLRFQPSQPVEIFGYSRKLMKGSDTREGVCDKARRKMSELLGDSSSITPRLVYINLGTSSVTPEESGLKACFGDDFIASSDPAILLKFFEGILYEEIGNHLPTRIAY